MNFLVVFLISYMFAVTSELLSHIFTGKYLNSFDKNVDEEERYWKDSYEFARRFKGGLFTKKQIKELKKPYSLVAFYEFLKSLSEEDRIQLLITNESLIIRQVMKLDDAMKTYFAFLIGDFTYPEDFLDYHYDEMLLQFLEENAVHLRENSLKALYHIGHAQTINDAFMLLSKRNLSHSEKLLSDGLSEYTSNKKNLVDCLMGSFDSYLDCYRNAVVTFMNRDDNHEYDELLKWYLDHDLLSTDLQCTVLRLIGKDTSKINGEYIARYFDEHNEADSWESMTVAARLLGDFERTDYIMNVLQKALTAKTWYIRMNTAKSMCRLGLDDEEIARIENGKDTYAKDALNYAMRRM